MTGISIFVNTMACALAFSLRKDMLNPLFLFALVWNATLILDQVVSSPELFEHFQSVSRFFLETGNSLAGNFHVPSVHADYVPISNTEDTNVFTIYYSYFLDGGFVAVFGLSTVYSFCITQLYLGAKSGDKRYLLLYALLLSGIIFSIVSERFFLGLNGTLKAIVFWWSCYYFFAEKRVPAIVVAGGEHGR